MNFHFCWMSGGKEKHLRVDAPTLEEAKNSFKTLKPRTKVTNIKDVTSLVKAGFYCW